MTNEQYKYSYYKITYITLILHQPRLHSYKQNKTQIGITVFGICNLLHIFHCNKINTG